MEVSCPNCTQRLRYSDQLVNPLLRCRNCQTKFRPADLFRPSETPVMAVAVEEDRNYDEQLEAFEANERADEKETLAPTRKSGKSGWGYLSIFLIVIALKVAPRLLREVFREKKQPPPPANFRHVDPQALQRMMQQAPADRAKQEAVPAAQPPAH